MSRPGSTDSTNAFASSRSSRIRSEPGRPVSRSASSPLTRSSRADAQEQILDLRRLAFEHLGEQVFGDEALAAGELGDEPFGVGVAGQGERREPQARDPPLGPLVQQRGPGVGQHDARGMRSSRVSGMENRRSAARISVSSPARRSWCKPRRTS